MSLRAATHANRRALMDHRPVLANKFGGHLQTTLDRAQIRISRQRTELALRQRQFEGAFGIIGDRVPLLFEDVRTNSPPIQMNVSPTRSIVTLSPCNTRINVDSLRFHD